MSQRRLTAAVALGFPTPGKKDQSPPDLRCFKQTRK
jgi:hypothetical protein